MNELTTYRWSIDEDLHHYRRCGFTGVGVWRRKLTDFGVERGVELLRDSGLTVSNLMWAGGFTGNDGRTLAESVADAAEAIGLAERIGARCLVLYTGGRNYHTHRHAGRLLRSALEDLAPIAEARGVTLALEPMHPACASEWTLLTSLEAALDLIDEYDCSCLRLVYDSYHFPKFGAAEIAEIADKAAVVHLGDIGVPHSIDQDRCPLGEGRAPLTEIVAAFVANGFEGFFDVELVGLAADPSEYESIVEQSAQCGANLLAAATGLVPSTL